MPDAATQTQYRPILNLVLGSLKRNNTDSFISTRKNDPGEQKPKRSSEVFRRVSSLQIADFVKSIEPAKHDITILQNSAESTDSTEVSTVVSTDSTEESTVVSTDSTEERTSVVRTEKKDWGTLNVVTPSGYCFPPYWSYDDSLANKVGNGYKNAILTTQRSMFGRLFTIFVALLQLLLYVLFFVRKKCSLELLVTSILCDLYIFSLYTMLSSVTYLQFIISTFDFWFIMANSTTACIILAVLFANEGDINTCMLIIFSTWPITFMSILCDGLPLNLRKRTARARAFFLTFTAFVFICFLILLLRVVDRPVRDIKISFKGSDFSLISACCGCCINYSLFMTRYAFTAITAPEKMLSVNFNAKMSRFMMRKSLVYETTKIIPFHVATIATQTEFSPITSPLHMLLGRKQDRQQMSMVTAVVPEALQKIYEKSQSFDGKAESSNLTEEKKRKKFRKIHGDLLQLTPSFMVLEFYSLKHSLAKELGGDPLLHHILRVNRSLIGQIWIFINTTGMGVLLLLGTFIPGDSLFLPIVFLFAVFNWCLYSFTLTNVILLKKLVYSFEVWFVLLNGAVGVMLAGILFYNNSDYKRALMSIGTFVLLVGGVFGDALPTSIRAIASRRLSCAYLASCLAVGALSFGIQFNLFELNDATVNVGGLEMSLMTRASASLLNMSVYALKFCINFLKRPKTMTTIKVSANMVPVEYNEAIAESELFEDI